MSYYNSDKNNTKKNPAYYNGNTDKHDETPDVRDYEMVIPSSEEYRQYTWNEYARGNVRNIMSEDEFSNKYPTERIAPIAAAEKTEKRNEKNYNPRDYKNDMDNDTSYAGEVAISVKKKNKFLLLAYLFILAIIILVVVISANSNGKTFASGGENDKSETETSDTTGDHFSNSYYNDKTQIRYSEAEVGEYLVLSQNTDKEKKTNWFDAFCDKIEQIVGG